MSVFDKKDNQSMPDGDKELRISKQDLADIVGAAIKAANTLNPIEQRKYEEELAAQKRRDEAAIPLAKIEQETLEEKKRRCSHTRYPMAMGARGGHLAPKGQGEWITSGQCHSPDLATLICMRCSYTWQFKPTRSEFDQISQTGMLGWAPPDESRILNESVAGA